MMRTRLAARYDALRGSYWFLPTMLSLGAVALAFAMGSADEAVAQLGSHSFPWLYRGGPDGARAVLTTVAGSMIGIAGVTFSITIVALSLASTQFGPRLLRNFMRDRGNQLVLGTFVATFLYCLVVLRDVRSSAGEPYVPVLSVSTAVALAFASLAVLIYFFHHVASSIQAEHVVAAVARDLERAVERFCAARPAQAPAAWTEPGESVPADFEAAAVGIPADASGYVQAVDEAALLACAREHDLVVDVAHRAGDFVVARGALARAWPPDRVDDAVQRRLRDAFVVGDRRTDLQDVEYSIRQLVEVALRALSPGINDPFTSMNCIDWLGASLARLAAHEMPGRWIYDGDGRLRLRTDAPDFGGMVAAAFDQIRQAAERNVSVTIRLLEAVGAIGAQVRTTGEAEALRQHADTILAGALRDRPPGPDRSALEERHDAALRALGGALARPMRRAGRA
jgi:uncharacterized membrane protein